MYAVYHGPRGLKGIAQHVHGLAVQLARGLVRLGTGSGTIILRHGRGADRTRKDRRRPRRRTGGKLNLRRIDAGTIGVSLDETTTAEDVRDVLAAFAGARTVRTWRARRAGSGSAGAAERLSRPSLFNTHHSETEMLRYNALARVPRSLPDAQHDPARLLHHEAERHRGNAAHHLARLLPAAPLRPRPQAAGYAQIFQELEAMLARSPDFRASRYSRTPARKASTRGCK